ncbi:hypothetical protein BD414DRAFT_477546 [Trametes punicea]|nr:hypothetical protein BD414DRAFT_477546 [Trametes punicea]
MTLLTGTYDLVRTRPRYRCDEVSAVKPIRPPGVVSSDLELQEWSREKLLLLFLLRTVALTVVMSSQSHIVQVDASDTTRFTYIGKGWETLSGPSVDPDKEGPIYNNTLQVAPLEDISVAFPFNGTKISVYGTIRPPTASDAPLPISKYSVIGWDYAGIPSDQPYQAPNVSQPVNDVNFWSSQEMPYHQYILTINITSATANMPYYLDYVAIEVPGPGPSSTPPTSAASSAASTSAFAASQTASNSTIGAPMTTAGTSDKSSVPIGAIIGASIGGSLVAASAIAVLLYRYKRRRMPPNYDHGSVGRQDPPPHVIPFVDPSQATAMTQAGDRGLLFVPGLPSTSPTSSSRPLSPTGTVLPSQKALAVAAERQSTMDAQLLGSGSSAVDLDRKDPASLQSVDPAQGPGPSSEASSSNMGPPTEAPMYSPPASELRQGLADDEDLPPAYTPS